ncbi:hypothetical protein DSO57_1001593 [Entomophthora muscae]|uniref:Uncharacterized protein n=1 Tax=Entomophthora muscae TaxID=34485 RepID=A0ACC2SBH5_9FUNG|nr:hypothetical protein DSO57_1001593 [Entomophthora muscae]
MWLLIPLFLCLAGGEYVAQWFPQLIDHQAPTRFWQRYFMNADHYRSGGPAFLYVVGEQAAQNYTVSDSLAVALAEEHGGVVYALEHRFYGLSQPFFSLRTETLQYLTSTLAIQDLVNFAQSVPDPLDGRPNWHRQWFLIGGSYGGTLAAWARQARPDVFHGALASSAPLVAKEDFPEYDMAIAHVLGSKCAKHMAAVVNYVDSLYVRNQGFQRIKDALGCKSLDDIHFMYTLYDSIALIVQYDAPKADPNVAMLCRSINAPSTPAALANLIKVVLRFFHNEGATCTQFANTKDLKQTRIQETAQVRQWNYQCCTEFGFWQSAPKNGLSMRSRFLTKEWFNSFFWSTPHFSMTVGPPNTRETNYRHAGKYIGTQRIIFTNGANDPWAHLSITSPKQSSTYRPVILIPNASHVTDLFYPDPKDPPELRAAHKTILDTFRQWIRPHPIFPFKAINQ